MASETYEFKVFDFASLSDLDLEILKANAMKSMTGVFRYNFHCDFKDPLQEMLICILKNSKSAIHKHSQKDEVICLVEGEAKVIFYDDNLEVMKDVYLKDKGISSFIRIPKNCWHQIIAISESIVIHEITSGPFDSTSIVRS